MSIKEFIIKNFISIILILTIIILLLQRCTESHTLQKPIIETKYDTTYITKDSLIYSKPKIIKKIIHDTIPAEYEYVDEDFESLKYAYNALVNQCVDANIYRDSFKLDSFGTATIIDTVQLNELKGRSFNYSLKIPIVTKTVTIHDKPKTQIYIGGGISGNKVTLVNDIKAGILIKNKKDQIFIFNTGLNSNGYILGEISSYWKIKIKK